MRTLLAAALIALLQASPASAQVRSQAIPSDRPDPQVEAARDPDDGDDLTPIAPRAASPATPVPSGALARTVENDVGVAAGSIVVVTARRRLYLGLPDGTMRSYPVAVGKRGASWRGTATVGRKVVSPTWHPTRRQRRLKRVPAVVAPGRRNPLGTRALYLFRGGRDTLYRIHGTNSPGSIGRAVSSGCIRMRNADVEDLYRRVPVGTVVTVR